jgi:phage terminase large subunit GpA-like protein
MLDVPIFTADLPGVADGRRTLFGELARLAKPEVELTVSEFADRYRVVASESGSPFPGPWRTDRVPFLREPMDCLHPNHPSRRVTVKASAQTGKSELGVCWFAFIVDRAPAPVLTVLPTGAEAVKYNRVKLQTMIDASPRIRHRVRPEKFPRRSGLHDCIQEVLGRVQSDHLGELEQRLANGLDTLAHPR